MNQRRRDLLCAVLRAATDVILSALLAVAFTVLAYWLCQPIAAACAAAGAMLLAVVVSAAVHDMRSATALYRRAIGIR